MSENHSNRATQLKRLDMILNTRPFVPGNFDFNPFDPDADFALFKWEGPVASVRFCYSMTLRIHRKTNWGSPG